MIPVNERVILHLFQYKSYSVDSTMVPEGMTQSGISAAVGISVTHVPRAVSRLQSDGLVTEALVRVSGAQRRLKAYFLTMDGKGYAHKLLDTFMDEDVLFIPEDGPERNVPLGVLYRELVEQMAEAAPTVPELLILFHTTGSISLEELGKKGSPVKRSWGWVPGTGDQCSVVRDELTMELVDALDRADLVIVHGEEGMGKSTLIMDHLRDLHEKGAPPVMFVLPPPTGDGDLNALRDELLNILMREMGIHHDGADSSALALRIHDEIKIRGENGYLFILDGLNSNVSFNAGLRIADLLLGLPARIRVIIATREDREVTGMSLPSVPDSEVISVHVEGMSVVEARQLLGDSISTGEFDILFEMTGGCPGWLLKARDSPVPSGDHLEPEERALLRLLKR